MNSPIFHNWLARSWFKIKPYSASLSVLLFGASLVTYLLSKYGFTVHEKLIPVFLSVLGLWFAIFQVVLNIQLQAVRSLSALRHNEYKEFSKYLSSTSELFLETKKHCNDLELFAHLFQNRYNEIDSFIISNNSYLFRGIDKSIVLKKIRELLMDAKIRVIELIIQKAEIEKRKLENAIIESKDDIRSLEIELSKHEGVELDLIYEEGVYAEVFDQLHASKELISKRINYELMSPKFSLVTQMYEMHLEFNKLKHEALLELQMYFK